MTTLLAFVLTLAVLIAFHEYGHYRVAKACGVKVLRFSIGFGRVLLRRQVGETEFVVSALPLGGYVRMLDSREGGVDPAERARAFDQRPLWQRMAIVVAGPVANLLLAVVLFAAAGMLGMQEPQATLGEPLAGSVAARADLHAGEWVRATSADGLEWREVGALSDLKPALAAAVARAGKLYLRLSDANGHGNRVAVMDCSGLSGHELDKAVMHQLGLTAPFTEPVLERVNEGGAAAAAGLRAGDRMLSVDGQPVPDGASLITRIRASGGQAMNWRVDRGGQALVLRVTPKLVEDGGQTLGRIDAYFVAPQLVLMRQGPVDALTDGLSRVWEVSTLTLRTIGQMLIGQASLKNLSGPLTMADYAGQSARLGLTPFLSYLAFVSVSLGVLNLLPLPMLDGGQLMYYLFEGLSGRPVSEWWHRQLQRAGAFVLLLMMALALSNDMTRLLGLH